MKKLQVLIKLNNFLVLSLDVINGLLRESVKSFVPYFTCISVLCADLAQLTANLAGPDETVLQMLPTYSWPETKTNSYAVIGGEESGFYLALADAKMVAQRLSSDKNATVTEYMSLVDPQRHFSFVCCPFNSPERSIEKDLLIDGPKGAVIDPNGKSCLEEEILSNAADSMAFAKKCLSSGNFLDLPDFSRLADMTWAGSMVGGALRNVPMVIGTFSYGRECFVELFFVHKGCGCALIASCDGEDRSAIDSWLAFFTEAALHLETR